MMGKVGRAAVVSINGIWTGQIIVFENAVDPDHDSYFWRQFRKER
jgi:hypothetical protein